MTIQQSVHVDTDGKEGIYQMLCKECKKEFQSENVNKKRRKFCSVRCRCVNGSRERYKRMKKTPEYKAYRTAYHKQWREKNRLKWNELCNAAYHRRQDARNIK